jgi:hypothetical protein
MKYSIIKDDTTVSTSMHHTISPDGYCMYRAVVLLFMSYSKYPRDYSTTLLKNDHNKIKRCEDLYDNIIKYGTVSLNSGGQNYCDTFPPIFRIFYTRIVAFLKKQIQIERDKTGLDEHSDFPSENSAGEFTLEEMLKVIEEMLSW